MSHLREEGGKRLLARVRRIRGQIEGVERALMESDDCYAVLQQTAAARGALNGLMAELIDSHVQHHVLGTGKHKDQSEKGAEELMEIVRSYLR
jgi:DNA-binding FrmR family transcriptional regulator